MPYAHVADRFNNFLTKLNLTIDQRVDGITKHWGVRNCLNRHYYGIASNEANSMLVGSWGKGTEVRPPRDIDVLFVLPTSVHTKYESRLGNKQSQLLQEVKEVLRNTYSTTKMRADGQVVIVPFTTYAVEVLPAFLLSSGQYWICDTNQGGKYKPTDPVAELDAVSTSDTLSSGNTRHLVRMFKRWQEYCNVPLKSFWIELLAVEFLETWEHRGNGTIYYDWMVRDFLNFIIGKANQFIFVPGTYELIYLSDDWKSRAETAYTHALPACGYEAADYKYITNDEWEKIFGPDIVLD